MLLAALLPGLLLRAPEARAEEGGASGAGTSGAEAFGAEALGTEAAGTGTGTRSGISAVITFGRIGAVRGGRILPLQIEYDPGEGAAFTGRVSILAPESDGSLYEYEYPLRAAGRLQETYYIPLSYDARQLIVQVRDAAGEMVLFRDVPLNTDPDIAQIFIGALCDDFDRLSWLNDIPVNYGLFRARLFSFDAETFPVEAEGLDMLDVILVTDYKIRNLTELQTRVLLDWVRAGGVLLIGTGARAEDTLGRFAPELLDTMYEEAELFPAEFAFERETGPGAPSLELPCVFVSLRGGNVLLTGNGYPLISATGQENGSIVVTAFDLTDLDEYARQHPSFADGLLTTVLGSARLNELARELYGAENEKYRTVLSLINLGAAGKFPPVSLYALAIVAYILLVGPGMYLFLSQRDASEHYRRGVVLIALFFAALVYSMGARTRFKGVFYNYASIRRYDRESIAETGYLNLRSPYNRDYTADLDPAYSIVPLTAREVRDWSDRDPLTDERSVRIVKGEETAQLQVSNAGAFTPKLFQLDRNEENPRQAGIFGEIRFFDGKITGTLVNRFDHPVHNTAVLLYGHLLEIGRMEPGELVTLDGYETVCVPLGNSYEISKTIVGEDEPDKAGILTFYRDYYAGGCYSDARILCFPENEDAQMVRSALEHKGISLLASREDVEDSDGSLVCRAVNIKEPMVLSGQYEAVSNVMYTEEPLVLEYRLGYDIAPERLTIEWVDGRFGSFEGNMYIYNHLTGSYELADPKKTSYSAAELAPYISPANTLTIRYTYSGSSRGRWEMPLPLLYVTGREV